MKNVFFPSSRASFAPVCFGAGRETLANMRENAILQGETSHASVAQLDRASVFVTDDGNPQSPCSSKTCEISEPCDSHSPSQTPV